MSMRAWTNKHVKLAVLLAVMIGLSSTAWAEKLVVTIKVSPESSRVVIEGSGAARAQWSFTDSYGSVLGLAGRIENFQLFTATGYPIEVRKLAPGQFESEKPAGTFKYEVKLSPPAIPADAAMVSWLTRERGVLMLSDFLPLPAGKNHSTSALVRIEVPRTYTVLPRAAITESDFFFVPDVTQAVLAVGEHLRTKRATEAGMNFELIADGQWAFADDDVIELVNQVLGAHRHVFGGMPAKSARLILFPYPQNGSATQWSAETRGTTVTLLMGKLPSKVGALAQLSTPLCHELFHLWVPNALALDGDYDWFYEGFTMYQAARVAVRLNLMTFQEFLNAIGHAYDLYLKDAARDRWSLVEASRRRWTGGTSSVYSKSMLIALLIDLKKRASGNERGLDDLYQKLFAKYQVINEDQRERKDGNDAVIALLDTERAVSGSAAAAINDARAIDLPKELAPYGLSVEKVGLSTRVAAAERLTKRQRELLRELGYNVAGHSAR
jgi:predicted metalloprotease with PDZ domain